MCRATLSEVKETCLGCLDLDREGGVEGYSSNTTRVRGGNIQLVEKDWYITGHSNRSKLN